MKPKEKAIELVDKCRKYVDDGRHNGLYSGEITFNNQKQCALIAVNEIINELGDIFLFSKCDYWQEVKEEINRL